MTAAVSFEIISDATEAMLRRFNDANLKDSCVVFVPIHTDGPGGVDTETWDVDPAFPNPLPCRAAVIPNAENETATADQLRTAARWTVAFSAGTLIAPTRRLRVSVVQPDDSVITHDLDIAGGNQPKSRTMMTKYRCVSAATPTITST